MSAVSRLRQWLADWWKRHPVPVDQVSMARQIRANVARHDAAEKELAAIRADYAALTEAVIRLGTVTGRPVPDGLTANASTQPIYLPDRRKAAG